MGTRTHNARGAGALPDAAVGTAGGRLAAVRGGFGFALLCAAMAGVPVLVAGPLAPSFARDALTAAAGAMLLGALLARRPPPWVVLVSALLATAAFTAAGWLWQHDWRWPLLTGAALSGAVVLARAVLRRRATDPHAGDDPHAFLAILAVAVLLLPAATVLGDLLPGDILGTPRPSSASQSLPLRWLAAASALVAVLPAWLTRRTGTSGVHGALATVAVLMIAAAGLTQWPGWWALLALPLLLSALYCDARTTALLGLLAAVVLAGVAGYAGADRPALLAPGFSLATAAIGLAVAIASSVPLAMLAANREQAEVSARVSRDQLQALLQAVPALVAGFGTDLRHRFANRRYLQWHGRAADEVIGRSLHELFGERVAASMATTVQRVLAGQPQRLQLRTADGQELEAHYQPHYGIDGAIDGFQLLAQDASWKQAGERRERALLDVFDDAAAVLAGAGEVVEVNARFEQMVGKPRAELVGRAFSDHLPGPMRARFQDLFASATTERQGTGGGAGLRIRRGDDSELPVEMTVIPLAGEGTVRRVAVVREPRPQPIDMGMPAQAPVRDDNAQATLDAMPDAVVLCDARLRITAFNPMAATLTGWSAREAVGRPLQEVITLVDPASGETRHSALQSAVRGGQQGRVHEHRMLVRCDGSQVAVEESAAPIHDVHRMVSGGVLVLHDVSHVRAATENISHLAQHDYLTNLPNRVLLQDRLQQALARVSRGDKGALLYLDLDKFKPINDTLGHPVGDKVLQEVSRRLVACVREDDTVSRQGGDEFVLLLVRLADPRDAARVAEKLINAIQEPIRVNGQDLSVGASIGIALFPQDGRDTQSLMKHADTALYHAKETGRGRYCYFTDDMSESAEARMRTEHDLRLALANEDFFLVYQPRVQLPSRRIAGVEALVRWRRPEGVSVPLDEFIPVAEETGLVVQIDEWVLRQACRQARLWQDQGLPSLPVSVNVSLSRFDAERLLGQVRAALAESALDPALLEIEFREGPLFAQGERGQALVAALKGLGVRVAVDDFGSGASGVGALAGYRFDTLKIDRGFVTHLPADAGKAAITQAIVAVGRALQVAVVAKGVETHAQEDLLLRQGCEQMQGFLYSVPLEAERFAGLHRAGVDGAPVLQAS